MLSWCPVELFWCRHFDDALWLSMSGLINLTCVKWHLHGFSISKTAGFKFLTSGMDIISLGHYSKLAIFNSLHLIISWQKLNFSRQYCGDISRHNPLRTTNMTIVNLTCSLIKIVRAHSVTTRWLEVFSWDLVRSLSHRCLLQPHSFLFHALGNIKVTVARIYYVVWSGLHYP